MEWAQVWTIIGTLSALTAAAFFVLRSDISKLDKRIDKVDTRIDKLDSRIDGLEQEVKNISHYITRQEGYKEGYLAGAEHSRAATAKKSRVGS